MWQFLLIILSTFDLVVTLFDQCDHYQYMSDRKRYTVTTPGYPGSYIPGTNCRWYVLSPANTRIVLNCDVQLPLSSHCNLDQLSVSGDVGLLDRKYYCGQKSITITSTANKISLALLTSPFSKGGRVSCTFSLKVQRKHRRIKQTGCKADCACDCGSRNKQRRIVGGVESIVNEFPMMAAIYDRRFEGDKIYLIGGATIYTKRHALTAAHVLKNRPLHEISLLVGEHDLADEHETSAAKYYEIETKIEHPDYTPFVEDNDIAIVKTVNEILFSREVSVVCLPFKQEQEDFSGKDVEAVGWGMIHYTGPWSDQLRKVTLNVLTPNDCLAQWPNINVTTKLCTYALDKDSCKRDSGGPILYTDPNYGNRLFLIGVISYGEGCATDRSAINTRVTSYMDWINENTDEKMCGSYDLKQTII